MNGQLHKLATLTLGKDSRYTVSRRLGGPWRCSLRFETQKNFLPLPEMEKLFFGRPARGLVTLPATPAIFPNVVFFQFMFIILSNGYYIFRTNHYKVDLTT
jgi:hypothetical protein